MTRLIGTLSTTHLLTIRALEEMSTSNLKSTDVAIVGLAGRFPGAGDVRQFWHNLCQGVESISSLSDEELSASGVSPKVIANPHHVKADATLSGYDMFDAAFFGYGAREATIMDPQQRLFLECCWEAIEDAGFDPERSDKLVGVYAGAGLSEYFFHYLYPQRSRAGFFDPFEIGTANNICSLAARVSYKLNLKGPSLVVQTACSSSLVAVHLAVQSLLNEECDLALAGGVSILMPVKTGYLYQVDGILSPDGHCRPFDADARGTVFGSGLGVVVLKRVGDALADGDLIRAVIKGSAVNNDGASKAGFTAPNPEAQAEVVIEALAVADAHPDTITYVEAHGTGTALGDPIEVTALKKALGRSGKNQKRCGLGSVKANIGHLDAAAGIAGLIKTTLALQHKLIPPSLNFRRLNPNINFEDSPFYVNTELRDWESNGSPRRAGVSSFGLGGTNCHIVLEEAPHQRRDAAARQWHILPLSAKSPAALEAVASRLAQHAAEQGDLDLGDAAFTLQIGKRQWPHRRAVIARRKDETIKDLLSGASQNAWDGAKQIGPQRIAFVFPSENSQSHAAVNSLYDEEPTFRRYANSCASVLRELTGLEVSGDLLAAGEDDSTQRRNDPISQTLRLASFFVVEYSMARTLMDWGVMPEAVAGAGVGQYAAACVAGIMTVEDAFTLITADAYHHSTSSNEGSDQSHILGRMQFRPPRINYLSPVTAEWLSSQEAAHPDLWQGSLCYKGQVEPQLRKLVEAGFNVVIAVGPAEQLKSVARQLATGPQQFLMLSPVEGAADPTERTRHLHEVIARLWVNGAPIDWGKYNSGIRRKKTSLPAYPFEPKRYWPDLSEKPSQVSAEAQVAETQVDEGAQSPARPPALAADAATPEECLTQLFRELLGINHIEATDRFTDLGGDSLAATQLASRIRDLFGITLSLRSILEQPTVAAVSEMIRAARRDEQAARVTPVKKADRNLPLPLSYGQQRLWFIDLFDPGNPSYNITNALRIEGEGDIEVLERSINEIIRRHEVLRTSFLQEGDQLVQVIEPEAGIKLDVLDLRDTPPGEKDETLLSLARGESQIGFDLRCPPLLRATLFRLTDRDQVLLFTIHHIVSDGWSFGVMVKELATIYEALRGGKDRPALPDLPIQYADFAAWQHDLLQGPRLDSLLSYWRKQLEGPLQPLALPTDNPRPPSRTYWGGRQPINIPAQLSDDLRLLSKQQGVTVYMLLMAAFAALLERYTGQSDLLIGTPIANRTDSALEALIGFFVNVLVLRIDASGNPPFDQLLSRVRRTTVGAYSHQELPFERLVEELQPPRDPSRNPLFDVMFVFQNTPAQAIEVGDLKITNCEFDPGVTAYDLTFTLGETASGFAGWIEYNSDLFETWTIARMSHHWQTLLQSIVSAPHRRIEELEIITGAERQLLLGEWSGGREEYSPHAIDIADERGACLHELFEEQAGRTPDAIALIFGDQAMSYAGLNARANKLAHRLRAIGAGVETRVGICLDRSVEMIVGILGVLKAGGAYVPLDPTFPGERLAFMIEDSDMAVLLTDARRLESVPPDKAKIICLDLEGPDLILESEENPVGFTDADNTAYVIYTSGSTGLPKGVLGLHRGGVNRMEWMWRAFPFEQQEVCCQKTFLGFVDSVWEIFGPLLKGTPSVIVPDEVVKDPDSFINLLARHQVTRIVLVPSLLKVMLDACPDLQGRLPGLKYCVSSGEELSAELRDLFLKRMPQSVLLNLYGSSEVAADATCCDTNQVEINGSVPVGRPISGARVYILDNNLRPVPAGIRGQIMIAGPCLARGYLNHADLTAEKFIPAPFASMPGGRLYQTGDVGRYRSDGQIEYLGRMDHQVKVRGYRIELGEIEAVLRGHTAVREAAVVARAEADGDQRLICYVVCGPEHGMSIPQLRAYLKQWLPSFMVPSFFVELDEMPLTPSGKINRRALSSLQRIRHESQTSKPTIETPLQREIAAIVEDVLRVEGIGADDDLFEFGAHSLLMVKLKGKLDAAFDKDLPMADLFRRPTINALAELIAEVPKSDFNDFAADSGSSRARLRQEMRRRRQPGP